SDLIHVVDVESGKETRRLRCGGGADRLLFSPDSALVAALVGGTVRRWETASGKELAPLPVNQGGPLVFGSDGKSIVHWYWPRSGELRELLAKASGGSFLSLPRDGRSVATC